MKIALCCQYYREKYFFDISLEKLDKYKKEPYVYQIGKHSLHVFYARSTNGWKGRNDMIYGASILNLLKIPILPFDMWMFFDTDIIFQEWHILKMINNQDDIFMFPYTIRDNERKYNVSYKQHGSFKNFDKTAVGEVYVEGGGAGALKITRKVVEEVDPFLFMPGQEVIDGCLIPVTEDYAFCNKARAAGFKIRCDFNNPVSHVV